MTPAPAVQRDGALCCIAAVNASTLTSSIAWLTRKRQQAAIVCCSRRTADVALRAQAGARTLLPVLEPSDPTQFPDFNVVAVDIFPRDLDGLYVVVRLEIMAVADTDRLVENERVMVSRGGHRRCSALPKAKRDRVSQ